MKHARVIVPIASSILIALVGFLVIGLVNINPQQTGNSVALSAPGFYTAAKAASVASPIADRLDQEAGISAWFKADPITISQVAPVFRTIEVQNTDYIIGSVQIPGYAEHFDAHVYAHRDGWILAYYFKTDLIAKIIDIQAKTITSTKLDTAISRVAGAAGAPFTQANYYDFRYPNATHFIMVAEDSSNGNDFTINLPTDFGYFERGWASNDDSYHSPYMVIDGANANRTYNSTYAYGSITNTQLSPGVTHAIVAYRMNYGVVIILYRVP